MLSARGQEGASPSREGEDKVERTKGAFLRGFLTSLEEAG
jgi:hypothetical protein